MDYAEFWRFKENDLAREFMSGKHVPPQFIATRAKIREFGSANKPPPKGTCLMTDWYSFNVRLSKCKSDYIKQLMLSDVCMPADHVLQTYYENVIVPKFKRSHIATEGMRWDAVV
jgi:hypothetical protein